MTEWTLWVWNCDIATLDVIETPAAKVTEHKASSLLEIFTPMFLELISQLLLNTSGNVIAASDKRFASHDCVGPFFDSRDLSNMFFGLPKIFVNIDLLSCWGPEHRARIFLTSFKPPTCQVHSNASTPNDVRKPINLPQCPINVKDNPS